MHHPNATVRLFAEVADFVFANLVRYVGPAQRNGNCLNATRIAIDALARFAIRAQPLSVEMMAWNREYDALTSQLGRVPGPEDWEGTKAWAIGVDTRTGSTDPAHNAWAGHLVAVVQDHVVDCSMDQFNRPQHGITFPRIFIAPGVTRRFLKGKVKLAATNNVEGSFMFYRARPKDSSYARLPGFQPHQRNTEIVEEIVERMHLMQQQRSA